MLRIFIGLLLVLGGASAARAQDVSAVELQIAKLRAQLVDVVETEARLQDRVARLDEDLRPENVERSVASVGTTDAAALRARRREQLEKERAEVNAQLSEASAKRARLESEIAAAEAEAVRLKAASLAPRPSSPNAAPAAAPATPAAPAPAVKRKAPVRRSAPRKRARTRRRA